VKTRRLIGKKAADWQKLAGRRKSCRPVKKLSTAEKAADRRKRCRPAKKLLTGENAPADWQECC
jgi:hypothetical protein